MRVLFWGTPEFATPALRALLGEGFDVVGVVTQPDRPVGRSRSTLQSSPVKRIALEEGLAVLQPERPRGDGFLARVGELAPELSVVVAYGHILPSDVIDLPTRGTVNIRALDPKPGAVSTLHGTEVKLFGAKLAPRVSSDRAGEITAIDGDGLIVACDEGGVRILAVQPAGRRRMTPHEWALGRGVAVGDRFGTDRAR